MSTNLSRTASKSPIRTACRGVAAASLAFFLFSGCRQEPATTVARSLAADELARVGAAVISVDMLLAERARTGGSEPDDVLLERLIQRELLYAEARRVAFDQSPALQVAWKNLVTQRFQESLETQAADFPEATPAELEAEYARASERYSLPSQVRAALIQLPAGIPGVRAEEVRSEALRIAEATKDFGALAARSIHSSSRRQGGDLGWLTRAQASLALPQDVVRALFVLNEPGEVSPVMINAEGVFLLKLIETRPARVKPFEAVRDQVAYELQRHRRAAAEQLLYAGLRTHHPVQTNVQRLAALSPASPPVATHPPHLPGP